MNGRAAITVLGVLAGCLAASTPASAFMPCTYDAASRTASAVVTAEPAPEADNRIYRSTAGEILTNTAGNEATSCGGATTTNTDTIVITDGSPDGNLSGFFSPTIASDLGPGYFDEPGSSDEIEIVVDLGAGDDGIFLFPGERTEPTPDDPGPHSIALGAPTPVQGLLNLNAAETDGIDADLTLTGIDFVSVFLFRDMGDTPGDTDTIRADGSAGTGAIPFAGQLNVNAGPGPDVVVGGSGDDNLVGDGGADEIDGGEGVDELDGDDGDDELDAGPGADSYIIGSRGDDVLRGGAGADRRLLAGPADDVIFGNAGADKLFGENGNDDLYGGGGRDRCDGGAGKEDRIISGCEKVRQGDG